MSKSPSLRRIQADIRELALDPSDRYYAAPLENDMFEWHFTIRGADDTDFAGGIYHGRILLPPEYPFKPPNIIFLTPSGRFETHTKVCLSFSAYHPELWQPAWGIRLILEALISFLPTPADGAIGSLDWTSKERKALALKSVDFCCPICGKTKDLLPALRPDRKPSSSRFSKEIEELQRLQQAAEGNKNKKKEQSNEEKANNTETEGATPEDDQKIEASTKSGATSATSASTAPLHEESSTAETTMDQSAEAPPSSTTQSSEPTIQQDGPQSDAGPDTVEPLEENRQVNTDALDQSIDEVNNNEIDDNSKDPAWMMDPLLHLMIALMGIICYLLLQKWNALFSELLYLRALNQDQEL